MYFFKDGNLRHIFISILLNIGLIGFAQALTIGSYNIKMFDAKPGLTNKVELVKILKKINYDFVTVQEIVNTSSMRKLLANNFEDYSIVTTQCGGSGNQQIAFIYNKKKFKLKHSYEDHRVSDPFISNEREKCPNLRPVLIGKFIEISSGEDFIMMGVHLKAGGGSNNYQKRKVQYNELRKIVNEFRSKGQRNIVLMGDFNTTGYNLQDADYRNFGTLLARTGMVTASDEISCSSYWSGTNTNDNLEESSILDHILLPKTFLGKTRSSTRVESHCAKVACARVSARELGLSYAEVSDHCPIVTDLY